MYTTTWSNTRSRLIRNNTNDTTSTSTCDDGHSAPAAAATTLTTEAIVRECVRLGYYRNPVCNDILYLHHKGYTRIDADAFAPYTNVTVLWLEGNALSSLACGDAYVRVRPPVQDNPFAAQEEEEEDDDEEEAKQDEEEEKKDVATTTTTNAHADPYAASTQRASDDDGSGGGGGSGTRASQRGSRAGRPEASTVPREQRDVFSSLYGTLRQLYLHNNVFRDMPDLRRFARLDAVNLSNNFITRVDACCARWHASLRRGDGGDMGGEGVGDVRQRVQRYSSLRTHYVDDDDDDKDDGVVCAKAEQRQQQQRSDAATATVPRLPRCVCSTLHTLNLAHNQLTDLDDVVGLLCYRAVAVLDLSDNNLHDGEAVLCVLERLGRLRSLKLHGNPLVRTLPRYRKVVVARCTGLTYLDDRPVFAEERRLTRAWAEGGEAAEAAERTRIADEKAQAEQRRLDDYRALLAAHVPHDVRNTHARLVATVESRRNDSEDDDSVTSSSSSSSSSSNDDDDNDEEAAAAVRQRCDEGDAVDDMADVYIPHTA